MQDRSNSRENVYGPYEDLVQGLVDSGRYGSRAEVILDALSLLRQRELWRGAAKEWLKSEVQRGIDSGPGRPAEEVFHEVRTRIRVEAAKRDA
jgi:antitoxin ParD1/3/4